MSMKSEITGGDGRYFGGGSERPQQSKLLNFVFTLASMIVLLIAVLMIIFSIISQPAGAAPASFYWCLGGC